MTQDNNTIGEILTAERAQIIEQWLAAASRSGSSSNTESVSKDLRAEAADIFDSFHEAVQAGGDMTDLKGAPWRRLTETLQDFSRTRATRGATAAQTSQFTLAFKQPLFSALHQRLGGEADRMMQAVVAVSTLVDHMAQLTVTTYQETREQIISRQQEELLELSTPVVKLWEGVLAVPMIGTLDSSRTQLVMESLLQRIVDTGSELAIIDITGVPTVDTLVAQHLLKTVTAIRLMGADCIISGIRPQIAQTIVHLGIDLQGITTKSTLADALALALKKSGYVVTRPKA